MKLKTAIVYYSNHHGNTAKLVKAIADKYNVDLFNVLEIADVDLSSYDRIGLASGIYFSSFAKQLLSFAQDHLPEQKEVFLMATCGTKQKLYFNAVRKIIEAKRCTEIGSYMCLGYDTFGPFKVIGGIAKGHPDEEDIAGAVRFYDELPHEDAS